MAEKQLPFGRQVDGRRDGARLFPHGDLLVTADGIQGPAMESHEALGQLHADFTMRTPQHAVQFFVTMEGVAFGFGRIGVHELGFQSICLASDRLYDRCPTDLLERFQQPPCQSRELPFPINGSQTILVGI
jgi:hypothetical protein